MAPTCHRCARKFKCWEMSLVSTRGAIGLRCRGCSSITLAPYYVHMIAGLIAALVSTGVLVGLLAIVQPLLGAPIRYEFKVVYLLTSLVVSLVASIYFYSLVVTIWIKKTGKMNNDGKSVVNVPLR
jgi:hypothetical protein